MKLRYHIAFVKGGVKPILNLGFAISKSSKEEIRQDHGIR